MVCYIDINITANLFFPLPRDFEGRWYMWDTFWYCLHPCRMLQPTRSSGGIDTTAMIMCSVFVWFPFNFILLVFEDEISMQIWIVCLFASTHLETSPLPVKGNYILVTHGHWARGFFKNVPSLLWHGQTLYNGHIRGPVTPAPVAPRLAVEMSLPVLMT